MDSSESPSTKTLIGLVGLIFLFALYMASGEDTDTDAKSNNSTVNQQTAQGEPAFWNQKRTSDQVDLKIPYQRGPFWIISTSAGGSEAGSRQAVKKLRKKGLSGHMAWLGDYPSAKRKELWVVYVGPFAQDDLETVKTQLADVRKHGSKKAYAVTLGDAGERKQLK